MTRRFRTASAVVAVGATLLAACVNGDEPDDSDSSVVTVFGPYVGTDADRFAEVLDAFRSDTGIDVAYTGSVNFVSDLQQRSIGNQQPDVAMVPQPGVVDGLIEAALLQPLGAEPFRIVRESFDEIVRNELPWNLRYAVPYRSNTKSLVWFRPSVFEVNGWSRPTTLGQLESLVDEIATSDAIDPWCFSIFAGSATGWPATDWVEDLVLRRSGVDIYDEWAAGDLSWQSDAIRSAFEEFRDLVLTDDHVAGGTRAILQTEVTRTSDPLFTEPAGCAMYKQASFAEDWFPDGTVIGPDGDVDFFVLPGDEPGDPRLVTGGDAAVAFDDRPDVEALLAFLASPEGGRAWADKGGFISERNDVEGEDYFNRTDRLFADLLRSDRVARFDASDTLPVEVGSDLLWTQITQWISGVITLDELLADIDEALGIDAERP